MLMIVRRTDAILFGIKWLIPTATRIDSGTVTTTVANIDQIEDSKNGKIPYCAGSTDVSQVFPNKKFFSPTLAIPGPPDRNIYTPIMTTEKTVMMVKRNKMYLNIRSDTFFPPFNYITFPSYFYKRMEHSRAPFFSTIQSVFLISLSFSSSIFLLFSLQP